MHHLARHLREQQRRLQGERRAPSRRQARDVVAQILAPEADVPRLFGHVDAHHAGEERMRVASGAEYLALRVVDRLLAAEDEEEEQLGKRAAEPRDAAGADAVEPAEPG